VVSGGDGSVDTVNRCGVVTGAGGRTGRVGVARCGGKTGALELLCGATSVDG
jgi:hypothetical protein